MDVPYSKRDEMADKEPMVEEWLENHPAPSWEGLSWALYRRGDGRIHEHSILKQLYEKHITGISMFVKIIEVECYTNKRNSYLHAFVSEDLLAVLAI